MKVNFGYVRGNIANHQDFNVFQELHQATGQEFNVACCTTRTDPPDFMWDRGKIRLEVFSELSKLYHEFDILDTSEFYRDYSLDIIQNFKGKKSVTVFDNLPFGISNGQAGLLSVGVDYVIARTHMIRRMLELEGVDPKKISVIPSAVDPGLFKPGVLTNQEKIVLFVGRLVPEKGLWDLIVAMSGMKAELRVIGDGEIDPYIQLAQNCKTNLNILGPVSHEQLAAEMKLACCLVVPSIPKLNVWDPGSSWVEQFGVVILEGMATGLPVIASDTGSTRDIIVNGRTGYLFPPRSWDILQYYLNMLLDNYSMRNELGNRGRERVLLNFSSAVVGKKLAEVYS